MIVPSSVIPTNDVAGIVEDRRQPMVVLCIQCSRGDVVRDSREPLDDTGLVAHRVRSRPNPSRLAVGPYDSEFLIDAVPAALAGDGRDNAISVVSVHGVHEGVFPGKKVLGRSAPDRLVRGADVQHATLVASIQKT